MSPGSALRLGRNSESANHGDKQTAARKFLLKPSWRVDLLPERSPECGWFVGGMAESRRFARGRCLMCAKGSRWPTRANENPTILMAVPWRSMVHLGR